MHHRQACRASLCDYALRVTKSRLQGCLFAFGAVVLVVSLLFNFGLAAMLAGKSSRHESVTREPVFEEQFVEGAEGSDNKIAIIDLTGVISSSVQGQAGESMVEDVVGKLKQAREEHSIRAIVLHIDSPGGEVNASDVIYHEVVKTRAVKPVIVFMGSVAASGGYYVAVGADYIMASDLTITGSIGVILQTLNYKDLIQKIGVKSVTFKSGRYKDLLNGAREMTPEEEKLVQDMIDSTYGKFVGLVAKERKLNVEELKAGIADGRILSGEQAHQAKLVDGLGYLEDAIAKAKERAKIKEAQVVRLRPTFSFAQLLRIFGKSDVSKIKIAVGPETLSMETGKLYFLSTHLFSGM